MLPWQAFSPAPRLGSIPHPDAGEAGARVPSPFVLSSIPAFPTPECLKYFGPSSPHRNKCFPVPLRFGGGGTSTVTIKGFLKGGERNFPTINVFLMPNSSQFSAAAFSIPDSGEIPCRGQENCAKILFLISITLPKPRSRHPKKRGLNFAEMVPHLAPHHSLAANSLSVAFHPFC